MAIFKMNQKGDTLVEVLMATVILAIVLAGAYNLSARASRLNQQAFERNQVSNLLQGQSELLRSARDTQNTNPALWNQIISATSVTSPTVDCKTIDLANIVTLKPNAFFIDVDASGNITFVNDPVLINDLFWVWVEGQNVDGGTASYLDFVVNGCWSRLGGGEQQQSGITVRLERTIYDTN